jgi:hypothetical protein
VIAAPMHCLLPRLRSGRDWERKSVPASLN